MEITLIKKSDERIDRKTKRPIGRLKVTAYARVSTDNEEQLNSYESQKSYYMEKIVSNPEWSFAGLYADEGISGTKDYKREGFMKMIGDAMEGKFDLILTKSISRFARNTLDTLKYVRMLKERNIAILFEEENINTLDMTGELLLTVLSSVAQQESETISSHVKLGFKMKSERGELIGFNDCFGYHYDSETNTMTLLEEEVPIVKLIFKKYLEGHGSDYIAKMLTEMEIKTPKSAKKWCASTVRGILRNEKYIGDVLQGKSYTIDPISQKRVKNLGESDQYYIKNHHEPIISREDFERVQEIMKDRVGLRATGRRLGNVGRKFTFSSRIKCGFCGGTYSRRKSYTKAGGVTIWDCMTDTSLGTRFCPNSKAMRENLLENAFIDVYHLICKSKELNIENLIDIITNAQSDNEIKNKLTSFETTLKNLQDKDKKLVELLLDNTIDKFTYNERKKELKEKIDKVNVDIERYTLLLEDEERIERGQEKLKNILSSQKVLEGFDRDVFDALIDYIIIGGYIDGEKDDCLLRFVCKTHFNETKRCDLTEEFIKKNSNIVNGESEGLILLSEFYSNQPYNIFYKDETGRMQKKMMDRIKVRVEIEK